MVTAGIQVSYETILHGRTYVSVFVLFLILVHLVHLSFDISFSGVMRCFQVRESDRSEFVLMLMFCFSVILQSAGKFESYTFLFKTH